MCIFIEILATIFAIMIEMFITIVCTVLELFVAIVVEGAYLVVRCSWPFARMYEKYTGKLKKHTCRKTKFDDD